MSKKVSIVVPVHNASDYLEECVSSLLGQTYENLEIILINNASTDNSLELCQQLSKKDARIVVIHTDEPGVSNARNLGLDAMTGEFVTFVDSDDWLDLHCIDRAVNTIEKENADIVIWSFYKNIEGNELRLSLLSNDLHSFVTDEEKKYLYLKSIYAHYNKISPNNDVPIGIVACKLYKTELIKDADLRFNPLLIRAEDCIFSIHAFKLAKKVYYFDENLYHYRIHDESICNSSKYISDTKVPFDTLIVELNNFVKDLGNSFEAKEALNSRIVQIIFWHYDYNYFNPKNPNSLLQKRKALLEIISVGCYERALKDVEIKYLSKQLKVMVFLLRKNAVLSFYFFRKLMAFIGR